MSNFNSMPEGVRLMRTVGDRAPRVHTPEQVVPQMETLTRRPEGQVPSMTNVRRLNLPPGGFGSQGHRYDRPTDSMHYSLGRRLGFLGASMSAGVMGLACLVGGPAVAYLTVTTASALSLALAGPIAVGLATASVGAGLLVGARYLFKVATGKD